MISHRDSLVSQLAAPTPSYHSDDEFPTSTPTDPITACTFLGDTLPPSKPPNTTRVYFINTNGIRFGATGGEFREICNTMHTDNIDVLGIVETKLDTHHPGVRYSCQQTARQVFRHVRVDMSSSNIRYKALFSYRKQHTDGATL